MFGFHVSVLDPSLKIKDNSLTNFSAFMAWTLDDSNDLGSYIRETAGTSAGASDLSTQFAELSVLDDVATNQVANPASFAPQDGIWVTKNLLVWAVDTTDSAAIYGFDQGFSQISVPEPATYALLAIALAGLGLSRGRRT